MGDGFYSSADTLTMSGTKGQIHTQQSITADGRNTNSQK